MREIKFRTWDKANKEMLDIEDLHWDDCTREFLIRTTMYSDYFDTEDMILMQYAGLKDKNGKEIYEGDIVKANYYGKKVIGSINYWLGCFILENSCVSDNQLFVFDHVEVIGNIYDNPELLKED